MTLRAQDLKKFNLYDPKADADKGIAEAVKQAAASGKHVFIQVGGNWCIWCMRFNDFVTKDTKSDSILNASYVVYHLNWSPENQNEKILARYRYPQRFGFPVFLVLDGKGELIHTQNSSYLEDKSSYDRRKVNEFFADWSPSALTPEHNKNN